MAHRKQGISYSESYKMWGQSRSPCKAVAFVTGIRPEIILGQQGRYLGKTVRKRPEIGETKNKLDPSAQ